jgi:hypothetical protein
MLLLSEMNPQTLAILGLSESIPHSDSVFPYNASAVRIIYAFGLRHSLQCVDCPNQPRIRTPYSLALLLLSESTTHSDSAIPYNAWTVRIIHAFGLRNPLQCFCCPNQPRIRTPPFLTMLGLSESATHSDSVFSCIAFAVQINHAFGLRNPLQCFCCPNKPRIRTEYSLAMLGLSESFPPLAPL